MGCGLTVFDLWDGHRVSPEHYRALFAVYTPAEWRELLVAVDNGLGWAENESMDMGSRTDIMALLRIALAERLE